MRTLIKTGVVLVAVALLVGCTSRPKPDLHNYVFARAAVAADHELASQAGVEILQAGGNAVDAAVATSFTLSVVRPHSCGIGGGGFMVIYLKKHPEFDAPVVTAINYRETAPGAAGPDYYERKFDPDASTRGGAAVAVPGTVAGLLYAQEKYGVLDRKTVLGPAIRAARDGFVTDADFVSAARSAGRYIERDEARKEKYAFVWRRYARQGFARAGERIRNPEQARALAMIAEDGRDGFYQGLIAAAIVRAVRATGGDITLEDLAAYEPREVEALRGEYLGHTVLCMPPPSSGGLAILQMLGILQRVHGSADEYPAHGSDRYVHLLVEAMKHAFADRAHYLADPAFADVPTRRLLSSEYLDARANIFDVASTHPPEAYGTRPPPPEDGGTSHFSVIDEMGNAVACTETVNLFFGSMVGVDEYGFVLNDEMDDFLTRRGEPNAFGLTQAEANLPEPGKRPLSSMSPTIVLSGDPVDAETHVVVTAGASGGPRIITGTLQAILNVLLFDVTARQAVESARFHQQWAPDVIGLERAMYEDADLRDALVARGHEIERRGGVGVVQLIRRTQTPAGPAWQAASDSRKGGKPAGY